MQIDKCHMYEHPIWQRHTHTTTRKKGVARRQHVYCLDTLLEAPPGNCGYQIRRGPARSGISASVTWLRMVLETRKPQQLAQAYVFQACDLVISFCRIGLRYDFKGGPKTQATISSTVYVFKTSELICVIFRTLQYCLVLNTSVSSILNKFVTSVAPPSDKINSVFYLQYQESPLHCPYL